MNDVNGYLNTVDVSGVGFFASMDNTLVSYTTLLLIAVAILILKGFAMYKAARLGEKAWFWIILIINSAGILPIIYLIMRRKKKV